MSFALKDLRERWDEVTAFWADNVAREFEKNHLAPLEHQGKTAALGMDQIAEVLQKVRQACS
jgi:hypothetical protein